MLTANDVRLFQMLNWTKHIIVSRIKAGVYVSCSPLHLTFHVWDQKGDGFSEIITISDIQNAIICYGFFRLEHEVPLFQHLNVWCVKLCLWLFAISLDVITLCCTDCALKPFQTNLWKSNWGFSWFRWKCHRFCCNKSKKSEDKQKTVQPIDGEAFTSRHSPKFRAMPLNYYSEK